MTVEDGQLTMGWEVSPQNLERCEEFDVLLMLEQPHNCYNNFNLFYQRENNLRTT